VAEQGGTIDYLEGLVNAIGGVVWEFDWATGAFTFVSEAAERLLGFTADEWTQPGFWVDRLHPEDAGWAPDYCYSATQNGRNHDFEYRLIHRDGSVVWVRDIVSVDPLTRLEGTLRGLLVDITAQKMAEAAALRIQERLTDMVETVGLMAATVDERGTFTYVNEAVRAFIGRPVSEILGRSFLEFVIEEERAPLTISHAARMRGDLDMTELTLHVLSISGEVRETRWHTATLLNEVGVPIGAVVVGEDVTEREKLQSKLARKAEEFEAVFRLMGDLYFRIDRNGTICGCVAPTDEAMSVALDAFVGKRIPEVVPPHAVQPMMDALALAHETGEMALVDYTMPEPGVHAHWEARFLPLEDGETAVVAHDVSNRFRRNEELRESRDFLERLLGMLDSGVLVADTSHGKLVRVNAPLEQMFGYEPGELDGAPGSTLHVRDENLPELHRRLDTMLSEDGTHTMQLTMVRKDGTPFDAEMAVRQLGGNPPLRLGIVRDVTERRVAEERERNYLARLSAMTAKLGAAEDSERRRLAEELHDRVSQALAVARMRLDAAASEGDPNISADLESARELLEQAIQETRTITTELSPPVLYELGLCAAIRWVCEEMERAHGLTVRADLDADEGRLSDEARMTLFRATRELLMNVVKHAGTSYANVTLASTQAGAATTLIVEDEGAGFEVDADNGAAATGFGLFSIEERVGHLGGTFDVDSAPRAGTRVSLLIPNPVQPAGDSPA